MTLSDIHTLIMMMMINNEQIS